MTIHSLHKNTKEPESIFISAPRKSVNGEVRLASRKDVALAQLRRYFRFGKEMGNGILPNLDVYPTKYCKTLMNRPS